MRHFSAWRQGDTNDEDTGLPHLAQVAWNAIVLCAMYLPKPPKVSEKK